MHWFKLFSFIIAIIGMVIIARLYFKTIESKNKLDILDAKTYLVTFLNKEGEAMVVDASHGCHREFSVDHLMSKREMSNWRKEVEEGECDYKERHGLERVTFLIHDINGNVYNKFIY